MKKKYIPICVDAETRKKLEKIRYEYDTKSLGKAVTKAAEEALSNLNKKTPSEN